MHTSFLVSYYYPEHLREALAADLIVDFEDKAPMMGFWPKSKPQE